MMMTSGPDIMALVNLAIGLVVPLIAALCAVFCFARRRLSSWLILSAAGFLLVTVVGELHRLSLFFRLSYMGHPPGASLELLFGSTTLGHMLAFALILIGLSLGLGGIARRMRRLEQEAGEPRPGFGAENVREPW